MENLARQIISDNANELFELVLSQLQPIENEHIARELINANLVLTNPRNNIMDKCSRKMPIKYGVGELLWYLSANNKVTAIEPYSKFWRNISDDGITINSNYGYCIHKKFGFDQWNSIKELLKKDSNSRQAVIHIKEARDLISNPSKDVNCTISLQFLLRNNKLHLITTMRSNDIWLGLPYDLFNFTCLQILMSMELDVEVGCYYHNAGSLHLYKRDVEKCYSKEV